MPAVCTNTNGHIIDQNITTIHCINSDQFGGHCPIQPSGELSQKQLSPSKSSKLTEMTHRFSYWLNNCSKTNYMAVMTQAKNNYPMASANK